jgi:hypothetical protein
MSSLKKLEDEKLEIKEKEVVFANEYANIREFRNVSTGNENHLYINILQSYFPTVRFHPLLPALYLRVQPPY